MKLKAGVIGLGVGEAHVEGFQAYPNCQVIAVCDISVEKRMEKQSKFRKLVLTENEDDILTDPEINVVSIASYDDCHYTQIIKALKQDKHVFVEKPLCLYEQEARHIRELLNQKPHLKMSSNLILRKSPRFLYVKGEILKGTFGDIFSIEGDYNYGRIHKITDGWRGDIDFYSVVYGGGVHIIDLFHWLIGDKVEEVKAYGNRIATKDSKFKFNDFVSCVLKFRTGIVAKISANYGCVLPHFHTLSVYGTKATFVNGPKEGLLYQSRDPLVEPTKVTAAYPGVHKGDLIKSFLDCIQGRCAPTVTENDIFDAMSVCFAIEKSTQQSGAVRVDYI
jgi:predicted dehydrogenase